MRILLDNCVDVKTKSLFPGHDVEHVLDRGLAELGNGKLLAAASQAGFDVFVTVDKNIRHQQNLQKLPLPVLEIRVFHSRLEELQKAAPHLPQALAECSRFNFVSVDPAGRIEKAGLRVQPARGTLRAVEREPGREPTRPLPRDKDKDFER